MVAAGAAAAAHHHRGRAGGGAAVEADARCDEVEEAEVVELEVVEGGGQEREATGSVSGAGGAQVEAGRLGEEAVHVGQRHRRGGG